jgi:hypothetical protein
MQIPIVFPSDAEVVIEEVRRFRALSPEGRLHAIRGLLAAGELMLRQSPKGEFLRKHTFDQENQWRQAVKEFIARHAR